MAKNPIMLEVERQQRSVQASNPDDTLLKHFQQLVKRAEDDRNRHQPRIADCYKYGLPWLHMFFQNQPGDQIDEVYDELLQPTLEDFSADMLNTFTPRKNNWLQEKPVETLEPDERNRIREPLLDRQRIVFDAMGASNVYQAMQECYLHLGPGTMAMVITDIDPTKPLHCECIPAVDCLLARGPYGTVDLFRRKTYIRSEAEVLWPDADFDLLGPTPKPEEKEQQNLLITDGCWRDWKDRTDEVYHYMVECQGKKLYHKEYSGAGSCPFIVAHWSRDATTAWGFGPTYKVLPAIKMRNHARKLSAQLYDKYVNPITSYVDDGVMNFDHDIEPGSWVPRLQGSDAPESLESKAKFDFAVFEMDELKSIIRRAHYQDRPEQLGKTPPTAFQWADEAAERARRMGTPATNLVIEWQIPIYRRFAYLMKERGLLQDITVDGRIVQLVPDSPLLRAQEQEKVVRNDRFVELIVARFGPQMGMVVIDPIKYAQEQGELLGINKDLIRDEATMKAAIEQLMPILKATGFLPGTTPDVAVPPGLPAPV